MTTDAIDTLLSYRLPTAGAWASRMARAKRAYTTRRIPLAAMVQLLNGASQKPKAGDLMLARVERLGKHAQLEQTDSRRAQLFPGDEIIVAFAPRYAPDQFEAVVPESLGPCHLVAGGGVAGLVTARHAAVAAATEIVPLGLIANAAGKVVNLIDHAIPLLCVEGRRPATIASVGTSMNAGKTTSAAHLIRGLTRAGLRVAAAKVTGTGSGNDPGLLRDAGAVAVLDFTDAGHASTASLGLRDLIDVLDRLVSNLHAVHPDAVVIEVADGLLQAETAELLNSAEFKSRIDGLIFSSGDAMGACAGAAWLRERNLPVIALSGTLTRSPLARREAQLATQLPVLGLDDLGNAGTARGLLRQINPELIEEFAA